jgi:plasmid stabilization system protein ParE
MKLDRTLKWPRAPGVTARQPSTLERLLIAGDPYAVAAYIPVGCHLFRKMQRGIYYWTAITKGTARAKRFLHIGSDENKAELEKCWRVIEAEIAELEKHPVGARLRELRSLTIQLRSYRRRSGTAAARPHPPVELAEGGLSDEAISRQAIEAETEREALAPMLAAGGTKR